MAADNNNRKWSAADIDTLVQDLIDDVEFQHIAKKLGRSFGGIAAATYRPDVKDRVASAKAKAAKVASSPNNGKRWTPEDERRLLKGWAWRHDAKHLAANLGRTEAGVCGKLKELGMLEFDKVEMAFYIPRQLFLKVAA
jgi:hypothetical protein